MATKEEDITSFYSQIDEVVAPANRAAAYAIVRDAIRVGRHRGRQSLFEEMRAYADKLEAE